MFEGWVALKGPYFSCFLVLATVLPLLDEEVLHLPNLSKAYFDLLLKVSELSPKSLYALEGLLAEKLIYLLSEAIRGPFGLDPAKTAFDSIYSICQDLKMSEETKGGPFALLTFRVLIGVGLILSELYSAIVL